MSKNWPFTDYHDLLHWDESTMKYLVIGKEVCPTTGNKHNQGYVQFKEKIRFSKLKKLYPDIHFEYQKGTNNEASIYCKKDGDFEEWGKMCSKGQRNDLDAIRNEIINGTSVDDIAMENPGIYHQYGRTLCKLEDIQLRKRFRTEMTEGIWYWGKTGVGKSHKAFEGFHPDTHYLLPNDNGWWDGYKGQETVIINDFRGELSYNFLLQLVDKFPMNVRRRNREPFPFTSKKVIITSSIPPKKVYARRLEQDHLRQLRRRFKVIKVFQSGQG